MSNAGNRQPNGTQSCDMRLPSLDCRRKRAWAGRTDGTGHEGHV